MFDWYLQHVLAGATENELPSRYVEVIRRIPTVVDENRGRAAKERQLYG